MTATASRGQSSRDGPSSHKRGKFQGFYNVFGQGIPLLCIPGFASANWIFEPLVARLQPNYQLVLPDNRGMGQAPLATAPYRLDDLVTDVLHLMDDLGHEHFAVLGLSMGGFVAQLLALQEPERVGALLLLCSSSGGPEFEKLFPGLTEEQVRAIYTMDPAARTQTALSPSVCPLLKTNYPEIYADLVAKRSRQPENPAQVMFQYFAVKAFLQQSLPLEQIRCPTLILAGDSDSLVPVENGQLLQQKIPNAQLAVITETDHLFFLEKPEEVTHKIRAFLG